MLWYHTVSVILVTMYVLMKIYIILVINKSTRILFSLELENRDNGLSGLLLVYLNLDIYLITTL